MIEIKEEEQVLMELAKRHNLIIDFTKDNSDILELYKEEVSNIQSVIEDNVSISNKKKIKKRIITLFKRYDVELTAIAIDKIEYVDDASYIESQFKQYQFLYEQAKIGVYNDELNASIITENEQCKAKIAYLTLIMNQVRSSLLKKIDNGDDITMIIDKLKEFKLTEIDIFTEEHINSLIDKLFTE